MENSHLNDDLLKKNLPKKNVLFVTHTIVPIFLNFFKDFIFPKCSRFTVISHPLNPKKGLVSRFSQYKKTKVEKELSFFSIPGSYSLNFLKDLFLNIYWIVKSGRVYEIGLGTNNLNTFSLLLLKKLGKVKKIIFVCIDYTPKRYENPVLNSIYHWLDKVCVYNSDVIWNSSERMNIARISNGLDKNRMAKTIVMPDGSNFNLKKRLPLSKIKRKKLVYLGNMRPVMGVSLILDAFKEVLKLVPDANLLLVGGNQVHVEKYKIKANKLGLGDKVVFTGFIHSHDEVDNLLCDGAIGLAPFVFDKDSYEYYSDAGKPKAYLAAGMPIVMTRVPDIAEQIEEKKAGIVINYNKKELVDAVVSLLKDEKKYKEYRENAIKLSKKYVWKNILTDTYEKSLKCLYNSN